MSNENQILLEQFADAFNRGDLVGASHFFSNNFFDYVPQSGELTQPEALQMIGEALRGAYPDARMTLQDITTDGDQLRARMTLTGTNKNDLWGVPSNDQALTVTATLVARVTDGKLAVCWQDTPLIRILRDARLAPLPENAHRKLPFPVRVPEIILRLAWNGGRLQEKACSHLDHIKVIEPALDYCADCAKTGDEYPMLRMCMECGYVGCCDMSVNKHMKKHCEETGHPIMRSVQPGEAWMWCYPDGAFLSARHLRTYPAA